MNKFKLTQNYHEGDLVQISADMTIFTFMPDPSGTFPYRAELVLDIEDTMLAIIYKITEDIEYGVGEITFMVGNEMYYTSWDRGRLDVQETERPTLKVSCL
jgi:hypothetical protein|tara:strand:+ start:10709 stop:11011 length:303 start_codon:yes stop_codon:yes gene_type:complete